MKSTHHPAWAILREVVMIGGVLVALQMATATQYDGGEAGTAAGTAVSILVYRIVESLRKG